MKSECITCIYYVSGECFYNEDVAYMGYLAPCETKSNEGDLNEKEGN